MLVTIQLLDEIAGSVLIVVVFALFGEGVSLLIRRLGHRAGVRETTLVVVRDTIRAIWIVLAIVGVAYYTHLASELTVLAVSTVGGLIVSLALQATLSNVIAGLFLLQDGTLRIGDDITYSTVTGRVVRITLRTSWVMTEKGIIAAIANSQLMNGPLINRTATTRLVGKYHLEGELPHHPVSAEESGSSRSSSHDAVSTAPGAEESPKGPGKTPVHHNRKPSAAEEGTRSP